MNFDRKIMILGALAACLSASYVGGTAVAEEDGALRLYALNCGRIDVSDANVFSDTGDYVGVKTTLVDSCYLISHPEGDLLWDAGLQDAMSQSPEGVTSGPYTLRVTETLVRQLGVLGLVPADIEYVAFSHSHFDHVGNAGLFAGATWLSNPKEYEWMYRDAAREGNGFEAIAPMEMAERIDVTSDYDIFGDGSVTIIQTPGHTPGHMSLRVSLEGSGEYLLTGDLYVMDGSQDLHPVPVFNTSREETLASMEKFDALASKLGATVVIQHSAADFEALPKLPDFLD